jgi:hypothetical protein
MPLSPANTACELRGVGESPPAGQAAGAVEAVVATGSDERWVAYSIVSSATSTGETSRPRKRPRGAADGSSESHASRLWRGSGVFGGVAVVKNVPSDLPRSA